MDECVLNSTYNAENHEIHTCYCITSSKSLYLFIIVTYYAVSLVPPSINTCPGQTVMFNCTAQMLFLLYGVSLLRTLTTLTWKSIIIQVHRESPGWSYYGRPNFSRCVNNAYNSSVFLDSKCQS